MDFRMETFVKQHKTFLLDKIASYKPPVSHNKDISNASSSDITIVARVRPLLKNEIADGLIPSMVIREPGFVDVHELRQKINHQPALLSTNFHLDKAYGPSGSSEALYDDLMKPLVQWAWAGGVGTLFAYGQTGSGKTHSINELERLAATELMSGSLEGKREVYISVCELVGNAAFDLLNDHRSINILEDSFGETQLVGALEQKPTTAEEFLSLIETSMTFRKTVPTVKNDASSRSHAVCRIRIVNKDVVGLADGLLFVVDLAGSEMASDIKDHSAERMKETREINVSLSVLKDCIRGRALASMMEGTVSGNKKVHVPFRSSGLTKVLKNLFDINSERGSKTAVLACVKPSVSDAVASRNTLRYAELLRVPVQKTKLLRHNISGPRTWTNKALQEWIKANSGEPEIDPLVLAPTENGIQICRLPKGEFISRCQKTPGVTVEHAQAFYGKLWRLHIDSRADTGTNAPTEENTIQESKPINNTPFKERLKPGMYVRIKSTWHGQNDLIVMILCPEHAFENLGDVVKEDSSKRYICAQILPAIMNGAYDLHLTSQRVVAVEDMEAEVLMEYDVATRYFYMTL